MGSGGEYVVARGDTNAERVRGGAMVVVVVREGVKVLRSPGGGQDLETQ